jgi:alpha-tubulin suppressor-like RCC1 family protein
MLRSIVLRVALSAALLPLAGCEWVTGADREPSPRFASVTTGSAHSCALTTDGEAYCWGSNYAGELGLGAGADSTVAEPRRVRGGLRFRSLHAGSHSTCGIDLNDALHCWGGTGSEPSAAWPEIRFASLSPHMYNHVCGVTTARAVGCWGRNESGLPVGPWMTLMPGATDFAEVSVGSYITGLGGSRGVEYRGHVCGVKATGEAFCWGDNTFGQLGIAGDPRQTSVPTRVAGGVSFRTVRAGLVSTCGLDTGGALYCWGRDLARVPQRLGATLQFESLDAGTLHGCAVTTAGQAYCWGRNKAGELGTGAPNASAEPQAVQGGVRFLSVSAAGSSQHEMFGPIEAHTCGIGTDHRVYCWGSNASGQLGNGSRASSLVPVPVAEPARDA